MEQLTIGGSQTLSVLPSSSTGCITTVDQIKGKNKTLFTIPIKLARASMCVNKPFECQEGALEVNYSKWKLLKKI